MRAEVERVIQTEQAPEWGSPIKYKRAEEEAAIKIERP